jgi:hypothetical protein
MNRQRTKRPRSRAGLEAELEKQLGFLQRSAHAFDTGEESEASRIALTVRVLLHESQTSHSLLGQLDRANIAFVDTALRIQKVVNTPGFCGLAMIEMADPPRYVAMLDDMPSRMTPFSSWWSGVVLTDFAGVFLTRSMLINIAASQDGGAHVDPAVDENYARLSHDNALDLVEARETGETPMPDPVPATIRQIGHEVLKTLIPGYVRFGYAKEQVAGGFGIRGTVSVFKSFSGTPYSISTNVLCPCGSGKKVLQCHGAPGVIE